MARIRVHTGGTVKAVKRYTLDGVRFQKMQSQHVDDDEVWTYSQHGPVRRTPLEYEVPARPRPGGSIAAYSVAEDRLPDPADPDYFDKLLELEQEDPELVARALGVPKRQPETEVRRLSVDKFLAHVRRYMAEHPGADEIEGLELTAKSLDGGREALLEYMRS